MVYDYNERIRVPSLRVIDENGENLGVLSKFDALNLAKERGLDLVLVSPEAEVPVGRIIDWAKFKYEKSKKARKAKSKNVETKEWWFKSTIEERDVKFKLDKVKDFISKGGTAKLTVRYVYKTPIEKVRTTIDKILEMVVLFSKPVSEVTREGKNLSILVKSK